MGLQDKRAQLAANLEEIDRDIAALIAHKESLDEAIEDKRDSKDKADNPKRRDDLKAEIDGKLVERKAVKARLHELRPRREKVARSLKRTVRKLRNLASPKVVDLGFDMGAVRPLYRQVAIQSTVGHYSGGPLDDDDEEAEHLWRSYDAAHKAQGWACLGYPFGISRHGTIYELRGLEWVGAHTLNFNTGHQGCSVHGTTGDTWTLVQRRAFRKALKKYGLAGKPVIGHWQAPGQATACPGSFLNGYTSKGKNA